MSDNAIESNESVTDFAALEAVIGKTPALVHLKAIDHLDDGALRWIANSPLMFAAFGARSRSGVKLGVTIGGGSPGWAQGDAVIGFCLGIAYVHLR